jgi:hypothetical protein
MTTAAAAPRDLEHGGDRGHAAGEGDALAALEGADRRLERRPGRIVRAAVSGPAGLRPGDRVEVVRAREHRPGKERLAGHGRRQAGVDGPRPVALVFHALIFVHRAGRRRMPPAHPWTADG